MVTIRILGETPHVPQVAAWLHAEWWSAEGWSIPGVREILARARGPAAPISFVAEARGRPLGHAMLDIDDLEQRRDLTPWLASVWVAPAARGRGIASRLVRHVETQAAMLGHTRLHLHTLDATGFYAARGWRRIGASRWRGHPTVLMARELSRPGG